MAWDSVPWFIGGGAQHSPEVARLLAFAATSGAEGVVMATDLRVSTLPVPGGSVRVAPGAGLIRSRATGGDSQTYVARLPTADTIAVAATGAGAGRSDLIVAQIEDPFMAGEPWQDPADPTVGPYIFTRVIPNVPAGTRRLRDVPGYSGRSAITLARIDLPASTGTVTAAMITDLRKVAVPRSEREVLPLFPVGGNNMPSGTIPASYTAWPAVASRQVDVPEWATKVRIVAHLSGILYAGSGLSAAGIRTFFGGEGSRHSIIWEQIAGRIHVTLAGEHVVKPEQRGTTQPLRLEGVKTEGAGTFTADGQSTIILDYEFVEDVA